MGKKSKEGLGRALIKDRFSKNRHKKLVEDNSMLHTTEINDGYDWGRLNLQSVTAESSLQEFLSTAELAEKEFTAEKLNIKYVKSAPSEVTLITSQPDFSEPLTVPRRPQWTQGVTVEEQLLKEREAFLEWRRHLNDLQEKQGAAVTPYERNLELWRQLWRTLEKSDLVLLLLDARNPLLFRCSDLEEYAAEQKCKCILLLNKADLVTEYERKCWAQYFHGQGVTAIFFSAAKDTAKQKVLDEDDAKESQSDTEEDHSDSEESQGDTTEEANNSEDSKEVSNENEILEAKEDIELFKRQLRDLDQAVNSTASKLDSIQLALDKVLENFRKGVPIENTDFVSKDNKKSVTFQVDNIQSTNSDNIKNTNTESVNMMSTNLNSEVNSSKNDEEISNLVEATPELNYEIFDREMLLKVLKAKKRELKLKNEPKLTVGMIGYPNVGKSSTVNVLMQIKKVSVSAMPGHTRHVQSLLLDEEVEILDCPGLVLPAYAVTPDLLLTAVLPIDQMRVYDAAVARLCQLVTRRTVETKYGLLLPDPKTQELDYQQVLTAHAYNRGFMTANGQPDASRSARLLLKEAASGRLRWAVLPSGFSRQPQEEAASTISDKRKPTPREARSVEGFQNKAAEIDKAFFSMGQGTAHAKGKPIPGLSGVQVAPTQELAGKPWKLEKKHANKNKREKLRKVYAHLDQH